MNIILNSINDFFRVLKLNLPVNNATQSSGMELCRFKNIEKSKVQLESNCGGICRKKLVITFYIHWKSGGNPIIHFIIMWTIFSPFDDSMQRPKSNDRSRKMGHRRPESSLMSSKLWKRIYWSEDISTY